MALDNAGEVREHNKFADAGGSRTAVIMAGVTADTSFLPLKVVDDGNGLGKLVVTTG